MRFSLPYYSSSLQAAIMGLIDGSLPGWGVWASWLQVLFGETGSRYERALDTAMTKLEVPLLLGGKKR